MVNVGVETPVIFWTQENLAFFVVLPVVGW